MDYSKTIEEFISKSGQWKEAVLLLRETILSTGLKETIKWGAPVYTNPKNKNIVGLSAFKSYTGLWFFQGGLLKDSKKKLINAQEGKTKAMRQWRFSSIQEIKKDQATIIVYIKEALKNEESGLSIKPVRKTKPLVIPPLLQSALTKDKKLETSFEVLSLSVRREYADYITEAKRDATKQSRLEKIIPMIAAGIGLHDKYKK